jgi:hypothetical protein
LGKWLRAKYEIELTHNASSPNLILLAADIETPSPVPSAIYIATHAGHFGRIAMIALGTSHPAISRYRRVGIEAPARAV